jgi:uncharacterized membrane protein YjgN (DUF898 family)
LIWFSSAIVTALASERFGLLAAVGLVSGILVPWMHHRLKAWQHDRARYGERRFAFLPATGRFYAVYLAAGLLGLVGLIVAVPMTGIVATLAPGAGNTALPFLVGASFALFAYLVAWPYFAARLQVAVWSHTRLGDVRFATAIAAWPLLWLTAKNIGLTLLTAGLYWPFAAVALARYRVECMRAESDAPLGALAAATAAGPGLAAGDAALDAFGLDIGL